MAKGKYDYDFVLDEEAVRQGNSSHTKILQMVSPGTRVLECGPADGIMTRYLKEVLHCTVYIIEIDETCYEHAIQYADGGVCASLEDDSWMEQFENESFDYILYADVLEHLRNPQAVLTKMKRYLKSDGAVILSVPNVANGDIIMNLLCDQFTYTPLGLLDDTHIHLFARKSLHAMIQDAGYFAACETCTRVPLFATEQGDFLHPEQRDRLERALEDHPTRNIYQYILRLSLKEVPLQSDIETIAYDTAEVKSRFYFDLGAGFSEKSRQDHEAACLSDGRVSYSVQLPENCVAVRFDPVENQACIVQNAVATIDDQPVDMLAANGSRIGTMMLFSNEDPQMLIHVPEGGRVLKLETSLKVLSTGQLHELSELVNQILQQIQRMVEFKDGQLDAAEAAHNETKNTLAASEAALSFTREVLADREINLAKAKEDLEVSEAALTFTREVLADREIELAKTKESLEVSEAALTFTREVLAARENELARTQSQLESAIRRKIKLEDLSAKQRAENQALQEKLAACIQERDRLINDVNALYASSSWKITKPIRALKGAFSRRNRR